MSANNYLSLRFSFHTAKKLKLGLSACTSTKQPIL